MTPRHILLAVANDEELKQVIIELYRSLLNCEQIEYIRVKYDITWLLTWYVWKYYTEMYLSVLPKDQCHS